MPDESTTKAHSRRTFLKNVTLAGASGIAVAKTAVAGITATDVATCDALTGVEFTQSEHEQMLSRLDSQLENVRALRAFHPPNELGPAEIFDPRLPGWQQRPAPARGKAARQPSDMPQEPEQIAYAPAWRQAAWLASGKLRSRELIDLYLDRIERHAARLECFVTLLPEQARAAADQADRDLRRGRRKGPLHGLPYGMKDLIDTAGVATTWGTDLYRERIPERDAYVARKLADAGAILLGKVSCGAFAYGDAWFGGKTRNPWNIEEGSFGSSSGSAASVAAGLLSFSIGTETAGSIVFPANRTGATGFRPTFGRVARTGCMALSWSLDKIGTLTRSAQDAGLVLEAINGTDAGDPESIDVPFAARTDIDVRGMKLGYRPEWFETAREPDRNMLAAARAAGMQLMEIEIEDLPYAGLRLLIPAPAAAAFEQMTLDNLDDRLSGETASYWPNAWRAARFVPAVAYIQAQRLRRAVMQSFARTMAGVDALIHPNDVANLVLIGNCTGHPALVLRSGFLPQPTRSGPTGYIEPAQVPAGATLHQVPFGTSLTGHLFDEARLIAIGAAIERQLGVADKAPQLPVAGRA